MEEAWNAKCSFAWPTPPPASSAVPPLPPLPAAPAPPPSSANQMGINSDHFSYPFAPERNARKMTIVQEPLVFNMLSLDSNNLGKSELNSSFLALLSGRVHHSSSETPLSYSASEIAKVQVRDAGSSVMCDEPTTCIPTSTENHGSDAIRTAARPLPVSTCTNVPSLLNNFQVAVSNCHSSGSGKPASCQASQGSSTGVDISSRTLRWPSASCPSNANQQHMMIQTTHKMPLESTPIQGSRVGTDISSRVLRWPSGSNPSNANEQHMLNHVTQKTPSQSRPCTQGSSAGIEMSSRTIRWSSASSPSNAKQQHMLNHAAQKMPPESGTFISNHSSAIVRGCPRVFCMNKVGELFISDMGLFGVRCFCHALSMSVKEFCEHSGSPSANPGEAVHLENGMTVAQWRNLFFGVIASDHGGAWDWSDGSLALGGLLSSKPNISPALSKNHPPMNSFETSGGLGKSGEWKKPVFPNQTHTGFGEHTVLENSGRRDGDHAHQRSDLLGHTLFTKSFSVSAQSTLPVFAKNHMEQEVRETPTLMGSEGSCLNLKQGERDAWPQLVPNSGSSMRENGNLPISFSRVGNSFNYGTDILRGDFPSKTFVMDQDGSSNIELRLGHPSQNNITLSSSSPTLHFGAGNSQKRQLCQSLTCRTADYPREAKKLRFNPQCTPSDVSSFHRQLQDTFGSNVHSHSQSEDPMHAATKNSLVSFLSHLNTEGNYSSNSSDIIHNHGGYLATKSLDNDSLNFKPNFSDFMRYPTYRVEGNSNTSRPVLPINIDQGKELGRAVSGYTGISKHNYLNNDKLTLDANVLSSGTGGCIHSSSAGDSQTTLYFNKLSCRTHTATSHINSNQCSEVTFHRNTDHHTIATHEPISLFHKTTSRQGPLNSETRNLRDGSLKSISLRHMERSPFPLQNPLLHRRCCCLSDVELRNVGRDNLVATKELNEGPYRITQQDAADMADKSALLSANCSDGRHNCFDCSDTTQRLKLCSKDDGVHFCSCHICHVDEQHCLRLGTVPTAIYPRSSKNKMGNGKEENLSFSGKCCCTDSQKNLTGCCFPGINNLPGALSGHHCGNAITMNISQTCDKDLEDRGSVRLGPCDCLQEHRVVKNDGQIALWRDVPHRVIQHSDATSNENLVQILQAPKVIGDQLTGTAANELVGVHQESESTKEQISGVSSDSSAPVVTEVSVEAINVVSFDMDIETSKIVHDIVVDEASGTERCGSSDEAHAIREHEEALAVKDKVKNRTLSSSLISELRLKSSNFRSVNENTRAGCSNKANTSQVQETDSAYKAGKMEESMNWGCIDQSVSVLYLSSESSEDSDKDSDHFRKRDIIVQKAVNSDKASSFNLKRSAFSPIKSFSLNRLDNYYEQLEFIGVQSIDDVHTLRKQRASTGKKTKQHLALDGENQYTNDNEHHPDTGKPPKFMSLSCIGNSSNHGIDTVVSSSDDGIDTLCKKARPVVCGNSGIISSGLSSKQKPTKFVSLKFILEKTSRHSHTEYGELCLSSDKRPRLSPKMGDQITPPLKLQCEKEDLWVATSSALEASDIVSDKNMKCSSKNDRSPYVNNIIKQQGTRGGNKVLKSLLLHEDVISRLKPMCKEADKCTLGKVTGSNKHLPKSSCLLGLEKDEYSGASEARNQPKTSSSTDIGNEHHSANLCSKKCLKCSLSVDARSKDTSQDNKDNEDELCELNKRRPSKECNCQSIISDSDAFCCVCGNSNKEDANRLLECSHCFIRVHQACYGIAKAPMGRWCCRPCKTSSLNIVCVLCGYGNGAMTRALKSRNVVNSLLKAWNFGAGSNLLNSVRSYEGSNNEFSKLGSLGEAYEFGSSVRVGGQVNSEIFPGVTSEKDLASVNTLQHSDCVPKDFEAFNSMIAGVFDPSVTQWVHMVCGLWTPGTRCPNVDTMSTFDVSDVSPAWKNCVCSMCSRPGGSCIVCRVPNCSVQFHPWCAHQKGLLQSEIEGDDNEKVGFYGRCVVHATYNNSQIHRHPVDDGVGGAEGEVWTCARTEGFKGRKRDEGFNPNHPKPGKDVGGCIVSEEQKLAWLHINGRKSCTSRVVKAPCSNLGSDVRKEYMRYKQSRGWKSLVVYKSGIHALGLYTSLFIAQGAMVVEYVGEIVGLRVADKREIEYQSGRRLQYKSACYFFRIDKEHIIDATRKGGIARFVNHSCRPNCAAKVISVRNEKKVVFFAERDIYQGEEITYDYHFNHEDEGEKIPCLCNAKNCRRYLN